MQRKEILFLTPSAPYPPNQGGSIRTWGQIKRLSDIHNVHLVTFVEEISSAGEREEYKTSKQIVFQAQSKLERLKQMLLSSQADLKLRLQTESFAKHVTKLLNNSRFDGVHIEGLEMGTYIDAVRHSAPDAKIVFDAFNAELLIQQRAFDTDKRNPKRWLHALYSRLQLPRIKRFEADVCAKADHVLYVSPEDGVELRKHGSASDFVLVPNGIHVNDYAVAQPNNAVPTLVYTGKMDYRPNIDAIVWFVNEIYPQLKAEFPTIELLIVGKSPAPAVRALAAVGGVTVTGMVPDIQPYMAKADVYIAPLRMGGGTRFKLLEAMAMGRPIVSTRIGAEGFSATDGVEMHLADTVAEQVAAIRTVLKNPAAGNALGLRGRKFVEENFDWDVILPKLDALYED